MMWDGQKRMETPRECWEVIGVDGVELGPVDGSGQPDTSNPAVPATSTPAPSGTLTKAIDLLDGKTADEFNAALFQDEVLRADMELVQSVLDKSFYSSIVSGGLVAVADGRYSKV